MKDLVDLLNIPVGMKLKYAYNISYDGMPNGKIFIENKIEDNYLERIDEINECKIKKVLNEIIDTYNIKPKKLTYENCLNLLLKHCIIDMNDLSFRHTIFVLFLLYSYTTI